jgi:ATP-dependent protease HslVU (ClpYQ) peptidase subunit
MGISLLLELAVGVDRLLAVVEAVVEVVQECLEVAELDKLPVEVLVAEVDMLLVVGADKEVVEVAEEVGLDISLVAEDLSAFLKIAS